MTVTQNNHRLCPACRQSGFVRIVDDHADGRPKFRCQRCDHEWTSGHSGAPFLGHEQGIIARDQVTNH